MDSLEHIVVSSQLGQLQAHIKPVLVQLLNLAASLFFIDLILLLNAFVSFVLVLLFFCIFCRLIDKQSINVSRQACSIDRLLNFLIDQILQVNPVIDDFLAQSVAAH